MRWFALLFTLSCAHPSPAAKPKSPPEEAKAPPSAEAPRGACSAPKPQPELALLPAAELNAITADDFITLHRGACFGTCPIYSVTVHGDGRVTARGERHVAQPGEQRWQIDAGAAKRLLAELVRNRVWALEPKMSVNVSDLPSARLEGKLGAHAVSVNHYGAGADLGFGGKDFATATRLEQLIDSVSEAEARIVCAPKL